MASDYGLTGSGFQLPSLADLTEETKRTFKSQFGDDFNTESNSIADKFISIFNEREYQIWLMMGSVYYAQTMQGAEGIYLDDLFGKKGIYRRGKTRGTGTIALTVDSSVNYFTVYDADTFVIDEDFELSNDAGVAGNIIAQVIRGTELKPGQYRFSIQNTNDQSAQVLNLTLQSNGVSDTTVFFQQIKNFIVDNTILSNEEKIIIDTTENAIYIGYDSAKNLVGLSTAVDFRTSPLVGNKTIALDVRSIEKGAVSRDAHSVATISPVPDGFVSIDNLTAFVDGSDIESDNEYRLRATQSINQGKATRPALYAALLNKVEGVEKVRIFNNNTDKTNALGIPPYRFMVVTYGGSTEDISRTIYETEALSNNTYGNVSFEITTEDDQKETIYHTKAIARQLEIRVRYRGRALSLSEESSISRAIADMVNGGSIAGTLYNLQLVAAVTSSTVSNRFTQVFVDVKDKGQPDSSYVNVDVVASPTELFAVDTDDITFQPLN